MREASVPRDAVRDQLWKLAEHQRGFLINDSSAVFRVLVVKVPKPTEPTKVL